MNSLSILYIVLNVLCFLYYVCIHTENYSFCLEDGVFSVVFNTKGNFVKDPKLRFEGGKVFYVKGQDTDFWSYFEARDIMIEHDEDFAL